MEKMKLEMLDPDVIKKLGSHLKYVLLECNDCGRRWGVNIIDNSIRKAQITCQVCNNDNKAQDVNSENIILENKKNNEQEFLLD